MLFRSLNKNGPIWACDTSLANTLKNTALHKQPQNMRPQDLEVRRRARK